SSRTNQVMVDSKPTRTRAILLALSLSALPVSVNGPSAASEAQETVQPEEQQARVLRRKLAAPVTIDGFEANTPLKEALGFLQERYGVKISFEHKSLRASGLKDIEKTPIKLPKMVNVSLSLIFDRLMGQV